MNNNKHATLMNLGGISSTKGGTTGDNNNTFGSGATMTIRRLCHPVATRYVQTMRTARVPYLRPYSVTEAAPASQSAFTFRRRADTDGPFATSHLLQIRLFAKQSKGSKKTISALTNEGLVAEIMKKFPYGTTPENVQVRMVLEKQGKSTNDIVSLKVAIQTAVDEDRDLVEVTLDQEVPVVKVVALSALEYQSRKKKAAGALPEKEVQMKAAIADNDLLRKVDQMIGYLQKGHRVRVRIRGIRRVLLKNREAVADTLQQVLDLVQREEAGEFFNEPEFNEQRTQVVALLHAPTKKK